MGNLFKTKQKRFQINKKAGIIPGVATVAIGAFLAALLFPIAPEAEQAQAAEIMNTYCDTAALQIIRNNSIPIASAGGFTRIEDFVTIKASTTYSGGYELYTGISADPLLRNGSYSISSVGNSGVTEVDFATSSDYNNKWGLRPSHVASGANGKYFSPDVTIAETSSANSSLTSFNTYKLGAGIKVDYTYPAGMYSCVLEVTMYVNNGLSSLAESRPTQDAAEQVTVEATPQPAAASVVKSTTENNENSSNAEATKDAETVSVPDTTENTADATNTTSATDATNAANTTNTASTTNTDKTDATKQTTTKQTTTTKQPKTSSGK